MRRRINLRSIYVKGIQCPACGREEAIKISAGSKIGMAVAIGFFSIGHLAKTFKCNHCGLKW